MLPTVSDRLRSSLVPTPNRARLLVWLSVGAVYIAIGSVYPFLLLLGWWEAIPAVILALVLGDRAAARVEARAVAGPPLATAPARAVWWPARASPIAIALAAAALGGALALTWVLVAPAGGDQAAHAYLMHVVGTGGSVLWDNYWYAGRYEIVDYSPLFYPVAHVAGENVVILASVMCASLGVAFIARRLYGSRGTLPAVAFAVFCSFEVVIGQYPFALGLALAVLAGVALLLRRPLVAALAGAACALASPLAFLFLLILVAGVAASRRDLWHERWWRAAVCALGAIAVVEAGLLRVFPDQGRYPFSTRDFAKLIVFGVALYLLARPEPRLRELRGVIGVYLVVAVALFLVPIEVGSNIERLGNYFALPATIIVLSYRRFRPMPVAVVMLASCVAINVAPAAEALVRGIGDPAQQATFWSGTVRYLRTELRPGARVEVVATAAHWESDYLPRNGIALARGWFRQDDAPTNNLFYEPNLTPRRYRHWLQELAVAYVVDPNTALDYSSTAEAALLKHPAALGLREVYEDPNVKIFAVEHPTPMVTPRTRAKVVALGQSTLKLDVARPGPLKLRIRYTPYWDADPSGGLCLSRASDGLTTVQALRPGRYALRVSANVTTGLSTLAGISSGC
jgi:hypothetical protein